MKNGKKVVIGNVKNGMKHGIWNHWWDNGIKNVQKHYKDGKLHGEYTYWNETGNKETEVCTTKVNFIKRVKFFIKLLSTIWEKRLTISILIK